MRAVLQAITEELQRLKADGEQTVAVSEETMIGLRALVAAQGGKAAAAQATVTTASGRGGGAGGTAAKSAFENWQPKAETPAKPRVATAAVAAVPVKKLPPPPVVTLPEGDAKARWEALRALAAADPVGVERLRPGKMTVIGAGALGARVFFVGDALGAETGLGGDPFVGEAGVMLGKMVAAMKLAAGDVYVANLVSWRPPVVTPEPVTEQAEQKPPTAEELAYGVPFIRAAIEIVKPELIVALGAAAAQALLAEKYTKLPDVRSRWHEFAGLPMMVTYHPSYVVQSTSQKAKRAVWEDLLQVMERAKLPISEKQRGFFR